MRRILALWLLSAVWLSACAQAATEVQTTGQERSSVVTVYRSPT